MSEHYSAEAPHHRQIELISAIVFLLAVAVSIWLRFDQLEIKPFHHDEGVNSFFLLDLYRNGHYEYNPKNYHGPTLYYFALASMKLLGVTDFALRFSPALFGALTVLLLWPLRKLLGVVGTPVAAWMLALSPGLVYFSRDFIHESSFGLFSLGMIAGAWLYAETKHFGWLVLLSVSAGLLFATKETAIVTLVVMLLAALCAALWFAGREQFRNKGFSLGGVWREFWYDLRAIVPSLDHLGAAIIIFLFINVIFYSSFFTNWKGIKAAVDSVIDWTGRGVSGNEHYHVPTYYLGILLKVELPLVTGAAIGALAALWRGTKFGLFIFAWATGITLAYSIIPYKTPWLMVSMLIPLALLCGVAAEELFAAFPAFTPRMLLLTLIVAALIPCGRLAWLQNFKHYEDNENRFGYFYEFGHERKLTAWTDTQYGYVYAQTDKGTLALEKAIREAADKMPTGKETGIYFASPDYWPMPWYLRDYRQTAFSGQLPLELSQPIVIAAPNQSDKIEPLLGEHFRSDTFTLRPGVDLVLYVRETSR